MRSKISYAAVLGLTLFILSMQVKGLAQDISYRILTAQNNSTLAEELNKAAGEGFRLEAILPDGKDILVSRSTEESPDVYEYKLLYAKATIMTQLINCEELEEKMNEAADSGYTYRGMATDVAGGRGRVVIVAGRGDPGVVVAMERDVNGFGIHYKYKLIDTSGDSKATKVLSVATRGMYGMVRGASAAGARKKIKAMLQEAAEDGFQYVDSHNEAIVLKKPVAAR